MKKRTIPAALLLVIIMILLCGCGKQAPSAEETPTVTPEPTVEAAEKAEKKALSMLEKETRARIRAQEKAKEGTLSKYIADWLSSRNSQDRTDGSSSPDDQQHEDQD